ncbi:MAG: malectin domain-containing carbohydrate-binding protein [Nanoarchaeota archaeon]
MRPVSMLFNIMLLFLVTSITVNAQEIAIYRINAGGPAFVDIYGNHWRPDTGYFAAGKSNSAEVAIRKTDIDKLYQTNRYSQSSNLIYNFPIANGNYEVILHFSETFSGDPFLKSRIFDVLAENKTVLRNISIYNEAQSRGALIKIFQVAVNDSNLHIVFVRKIGEPKISGIEIIASNGEPALGLSETEIIFDETNVGNSSQQKQVVIRNLGGRAMTVRNIAVEGQFTITARPPYIIPPDSGITFDVEYVPSKGGAAEGLIRIQSDDPYSPHVIKLIASSEKVVKSQFSPGLIAKVYKLEKNIRLLPNFKDFNASWTAAAGTIDLSPTDSGFFGAPFKDNFAVQFNGLLTIDEDGTYEFYLSSDDGSQLFIDGNETINNDNTHGMRTKNGVLNLGKGVHNVSIGYFEKTGMAGLILEWKTPSGSRSIIPEQAFMHNTRILKPYINEINGYAGPAKGGNTVTIHGFGFDISKTAVTFGNISAKEIRVIDSTKIQVIAPSGNGTVCITVTTPSGKSNGMVYTYDDKAKTRNHIRINAGGDSFNDSFSNQWETDYGIISGRRYSLKTPIAGTVNDELYQSFRQTNESENLLANVQVPPGEYEINLHFAELSPSNSRNGKRVFNVTAEGILIADMDVFADIGSKKALIKTAFVKVNDGELNIELASINGNSMISGLEVIAR